MTPTQANKNGTTKYRYYVCLNVIKCGRQACATPSLAAADIEAFVIAQVQALASDPQRSAKTNPALAPFTDRAVFEPLSVDDKVRLLRRLLLRIEFDGATGKVFLTLNPAGAKTTANGQEQKP